MNLDPIQSEFACRVTDVDLRQLSEAQFSQIYAAWLKFGLLIFPDQHLDREAQVSFAKRFGELEFDYAPISNLTRQGDIRPDDDVIKILKGNMDWHSDSTYMPVMAKGAVFSAHIVPDEGGQTGWADMRVAFDELDADLLQTIKDLKAYHSLKHSQSKFGHQHSADSEYSGYGFHDEDVPLRPLIHTHPETGRASLLIGRHAFGIPGMSNQDSESLLTKLVNHATQSKFCYKHEWSAGDVVVWDNRSLMHKAYPWDLSVPRQMFHSRIAGVA